MEGCGQVLVTPDAPDSSVQHVVGERDAPQCTLDGFALESNAREEHQHHVQAQ